MTSDDLPLSDRQLERLVDVLVMRLANAQVSTPAMLTVEDVCATFQVSRAWVYENAGRLGGVKLGPGQRAPLRFDAKRLMDAFRPLNEPEPAMASRAERPMRRSRAAQLLPVYDG